MIPIFLAQAESAGLANQIDTLARTPLSIILYFSVACSVLRIAVHQTLQTTAAHKREGIWRVFKFLDETMDALIYTGIFVFMVLRPFVFQTFTVPSGSMVPTLLVSDYIVANKAIYRYSDPKEGDIVVFKPPKEAVRPEQLDERGDPKVDFVKRCIGVPGDVIEVRNHVLYRNGTKWDEPYKHFTKLDPPGQMSLFADLTQTEALGLEKVDFKLVNYKGEYMPVRIVGDLVNHPMDPAVADKFKISDPEEMKIVKALPPVAIPKGYYLMFGDNRLWSFDSRGWGLVPRKDIVGRSEFIWFPIQRWRLTPSLTGSPATQ